MYGVRLRLLFRNVCFQLPDALFAGSQLSLRPV
jgi:hypothetical protein